MNLSNLRSRTAAVPKSLVVAAALLVPLTAVSYVRSKVAVPVEFDVRGTYGVPRGLAKVVIQPAQIAAIKALRATAGVAGAPLKIEYNGLTATPIKLFNPQGYLTPRSSAAPEAIARQFLANNAVLFRFSDEDLSSLRLRTRATTPDTGTTILVFEQQVNGVAVYGGDVLVNVSKSGQIISVGDQSFPQIRLVGDYTLSAAQALTKAGSSLGLSLTAQSLGVKPLLSSFGNLVPVSLPVEAFKAQPLVTNEVLVSKTVFPMADGLGRPAYKLALQTPQLQGILWEFVVDASSGDVLRRASLTRFASPGGGVGIGRTQTFRPDVQERIDNFNNANTAQGKFFGTYPVNMSGDKAFGRVARTGTAPNYVYTSPTYGPETATTIATGRGFKYSQVVARYEGALSFNTTAETITAPLLPAKLGQLTRGLPDAKNPSKESPFGWFYLPTENGGGEVTVANENRGTTRAYGYNMAPEAQTRNKVEPLNSPNGLTTGDQPYSITLTALPGPVTLADGRVLSKVIESNYTEGNNMISVDDNNNDDETTMGVRGYSPTRQFTAPYFDYTLGYEFGGTDASNPPFPVGANPDVFPGTVSLFFINNLLHDYLYSIGFDEQFWNFQQDNFGKGGAGGDALQAQVQDGSGTDNANMGTGADGSPPTMQMYLFTDGGFRRSDGSFDWDVIAHEFYHGVSGRSASKGAGSCLGLLLTGEPGGQGEGWSDYNASSLADDEGEGEYATGDYDIGIRRLPYSNYRYSYLTLTGAVKTRRDGGVPDQLPLGTIPIPFEVHDVGEIWAAALWDMREMIINEDPNGVFFDKGRLGEGTPYYIGERLVKSVDADHPIVYRASFGDTAAGTGIDAITSVPTINAAQHIIRPGLVAAEIASRNGDRHGPLATAVSKGARIADKLVLRGLQLGYCQPSLLDSRDSILDADTELNGGENRAAIWRAFASHGMGALSISTTQGGLGDDTGATSQVGAVVEDFSIPAGVTSCETVGPLPPPSFTLGSTAGNSVTVTINDGTAVTGADHYVVSRGDALDGPFATIATTADAATTTVTDTGLVLGKTYYYQVRSARDANGDCVSHAKAANTLSFPMATGVPVVNSLPVPVLSVTPASGTAPLVVSLSPFGTTDVDNDVLSYSFNFGDGSAAVSNAGAVVQHSYGVGSYTAVLTVGDGKGSVTASKTITVTAASTPTSPATPTTPVVVNPVPAAGAAVDEGRFGGGAMGLGLLPLLVIAARRRRQRKA